MVDVVVVAVDVVVFTGVRGRRGSIYRSNGRRLVAVDVVVFTGVAVDVVVFTRYR